MAPRTNDTFDFINDMLSAGKAYLADHRPWSPFVTMHFAGGDTVKVDTIEEMGFARIRNEVIRFNPYHLNRISYHEMVANWTDRADSVLDIVAKYLKQRAHSVNLQNFSEQVMVFAKLPEKYTKKSYTFLCECALNNDYDPDRHLAYVQVPDAASARLFLTAVASVIRADYLSEKAKVAIDEKFANFNDEEIARHLGNFYRIYLVAGGQAALRNNDYVGFARTLKHNAPSLDRPHACDTWFPNLYD